MNQVFLSVVNRVGHLSGPHTGEAVTHPGEEMSSTLQDVSSKSLAFSVLIRPETILAKWDSSSE